MTSGGTRILILRRATAVESKEKKKILEAALPVPVSKNRFVGREAELKSLHSFINFNQRVGISGVAGVGKSRLVSEFVNRYKSEYDNNVFWVPAASRISIKRALTDL